MRCENKTFLQNDPGFLQEISSTAVEVGLGQLCAITHGPAGRGHGRWATVFRIALMLAHKGFSTRSFSEYTLPPSFGIEFSGFKKSETSKRREIMQRKASAVWQG